jgi:hypothetical protein
VDLSARSILFFLQALDVGRVNCGSTRVPILGFLID